MYHLTSTADNYTRRADFQVSTARGWYGFAMTPLIIVHGYLF
ncbi:MAG TPA: hypothetical protein VF458_10950 [Ktedonobacteraceae bacterium]